jgi:polysaccharide pyruvyl transferase CsaB
MKVIHLISGGDTGGAKTHVHLLLKHLNMENEATLVCFMDGPFAREAEALGVPVVVLTGPMPTVLRRLKAMITQGGYELVHCHGSRGNLVGALLKRSLDLPFVSTVHSDPKLDYMGRPGARAVYGTLNQLAQRAMDYHIGVSESMRELLISRGFDPNRVFTIYNGIEFPESDERAVSDRQAYYRKVGLDAPEGSVVVGIAARLHPVKDYPTLLRAFAKAHQSHPQLRLLIAGDGQDRASLEALTAELGIAKAVCFAGWIDGITEFYRVLDINVLTSLSETFPYALTEGAREHVCAVSSRVGGVPTLIRDGETGLLFEAGDVDALAAHLAALASDPAERQRLGEALYRRTKAEFSAEATCRRQLEIYRQMLETERRFRTQGRFGALICGAYGMRNAGDEAILQAVVSELRDVDPRMPLSVMSRRPKETALKCGVDAIYTFDILRMLRTMRRRELYVNGGGSLLQDVTSTRSLWYYLFTLGAAKRRGCAVMMYGCGIGPIRRKLNRTLAGRTVQRNVDAVTLREENSLRELQGLGVTAPEVTVASDPALSLRPAPDAEVDRLMRKLGLDPAGRYLCFSLRRWSGVGDKLELFAAAADYAWETYGLQPLLLSVNQLQDEQATERFYAKVQAPCALVQESLDTEEMVGLIGRMTAVLAMRLHVLIFAASRGVPLAAVSYDPKVASFLDYLGQTNYVDYAALARPEQLYALIDAAAAADRETLRASTERIRAIERRNPETAKRLLEQRRAEP